jgi:predicted transcriptional regulator
MHPNYNISKKPNTIEKFTGSFSTQKGGCTIIVNSTINSITNVHALSVYAYLICRPDTWQLNARQLASHLNCGRNTIYKALTYLMDMNLLTREDIREKGKFLKSHYILYDKPQLDKGISPCPSTRDTVRRDAYKTKNIQNKDYKTTTTTQDSDKNTKTSSSDFVISKKEDEKLLKLREEYLKDDERLEIDFLRQAYHQILESEKKGYTRLQAFKGLEKIIKTGCFEKPKGYTVILPSLPSAEIYERHKREHGKRIEELRKAKEERLKKNEEMGRQKAIFSKTNVDGANFNFAY